MAAQRKVPRQDIESAAYQTAIMLRALEQLTASRAKDCETVQVNAGGLAALFEILADHLDRAQPDDLPA